MKLFPQTLESFLTIMHPIKKFSHNFNDCEILMIMKAEEEMRGQAKTMTREVNRLEGCE